MGRHHLSGALKVSSLLVCKLKRDDLSSEVQVLVKCSPKEDSSHQWHLFILAAPKKLLMLRGEETIGSCKRHGAKLAAASPESSDQVFVITSCLHPSGHIASIFWDSIAMEDRLGNYRRFGNYDLETTIWELRLGN